MTQNLPPPIPSLVPETAPFSEEQRAWLNGFFAGLVSLDGSASRRSPAIRPRRCSRRAQCRSTSR